MTNYFTIKEVALELNYSIPAIRAMIKQGSIPAVRIKNQRYRIPAKWLADITKTYATPEAYKEAKEAERFEQEFEAVTEPKAIEVKPIPANPNNNKEVKVDMPKKKLEADNTEIVTNKPKAKPFIPNPNKRLKAKNAKATTNSQSNDVPDNAMDDTNSDSNNDSKGGFLTDYKGIGDMF